MDLERAVAMIGNVGRWGYWGIIGIGSRRDSGAPTTLTSPRGTISPPFHHVRTDQDRQSVRFLSYKEG